MYCLSCNKAVNGASSFVVTEGPIQKEIDDSGKQSGVKITKREFRYRERPR